MSKNEDISRCFEEYESVLDFEKWRFASSQICTPTDVLLFYNILLRIYILVFDAINTLTDDHLEDQNAFSKKNKLKMSLI